MTEVNLPFDHLLESLKSKTWNTPIEVLFTTARGLVEMVDGVPVNVGTRRLERDIDVLQQITEEVTRDLTLMAEHERWKNAKRYRYAIFSHKKLNGTLLLRYSKYVTE